MPVKKIEAFATSDGKLFDNEYDASEHESSVPLGVLREQMANFFISYYRDDLKLGGSKYSSLPSVSDMGTIYMTVDKLLSSGALIRFYNAYKKIIDEASVKSTEEKY